MTPVHRARSRLTDVITLQRGFDLPESRRKGGDVPVIASTGVIGFHAEKRVDGPGVVIGRSGSIGGGQYIATDFWPLNTTLWVKDFKGHNPRFVYYLLRNIDFTPFNAGVGVPTLNRNHLDSLLVSVFGGKQEQRIADILSAYDDLIENNRRRMTLLEAAARQLYREWFVRLRFPGHEHTRITNGVPEGWERKRLSDVAEVNHESLPSSYDGEIEYIDISSVTPGSINETTRYDFRDAPSRARRVVRHGDIIWSCVRPNRRSYAVIWQPAPNLIASTGFAVITPVTVPTAFLLQAMTTDAFVGYLENHARGAAYPAVVAGDFERAEILTPRPVLIGAFSELAEPLLSQAHTLRLENAQLRAARDLLLPRLMSGEIAV